MQEAFVWKENLLPQEWDAILSTFNGHPLQSIKWGDARKEIEGIKYYRWLAYQNGEPCCLVRIEERRILKFINIAWVPQGPVLSNNCNEFQIHEEILYKLKIKGFSACVMSPWRKNNGQEPSNHTLWLDLTMGADKLLSNLDKQFRHGIRRAAREGVRVEMASKDVDITRFYELCQKVSEKKNFYFNGTNKHMHHLLNSHSSGVQAKLFISRCEGEVAAGAFILGCGDTLHYLWGASDRKFAKKRVGEAVQWAVVEWGVSQGYKKYDLGGVVPEENDGNYNFKKKLGGELISLPKEKIYPLRFYSIIFAAFLDIYLKFQAKLRNYKKHFLKKKWAAE